MKIISWNVNGFRAWNQKEGVLEFINNDEQPDIFCLQETKAQPDQIDTTLFPDYPYSYLHSAEKKGYSSTAVFSKTEPIRVWYGMKDSPIENEGRIINAEYEKFILVTVYTPNSKPDLARLELRHEKWDTAFLKHLQKLEKKKPVVICGDLNAAHQSMDLARPDANKTTETKPGTAGFTDKEREGITNYIKAGFIDTFRELHPEKVQYSWWSYRAAARERNVGWRIDYFLTSKMLNKQISKAIIFDKVTGSDHCPVGIDISFS